MNEKSSSSSQPIKNFDELVTDYRYAMCGCAIFLLISLLALTNTTSFASIIEYVPVIERFAALMCAVFGSKVAFRIFGKAQAIVCSAALLIPFVIPMDGLTGWLGFFSYLCVMNHATKLIRKSGNKISFTGAVTPKAQAAG